MPSYLITGAGRGIGFGFLDRLSQDANNTVIGLVRKKATVDEKVAGKLAGRQNVHIVEGDLTDAASLKNAAKAIAKITGGSLDVLFANANAAVLLPPYDALSELVDTPALQNELLSFFNVNVVGNIHLVNALLPLVRKGSLKKMVFLSTGMADAEFAVQYGLSELGPYSISKAAMNMMVAKYHAAHAEEDILFMAISPGVVDSQEGAQSPGDDQQAKMMTFFGKLAKYAPNMTGPISVEESVKSVLSVVEGATIEHNGGKVVSHLGNKQWI